MNPQITRYDRDQLRALIDARSSREGQGRDAHLDFRVRITPELLARLMAGEFVEPDGTHKRLIEVFLDRDGCAVPVMEAV